MVLVGAVSWRGLRGGEEVRRVRMLTWILKCVTGIYDTEGARDQHALWDVNRHHR